MGLAPSPIVPSDPTAFDPPPGVSITVTTKNPAAPESNERSLFPVDIADTCWSSTTGRVLFFLGTLALFAALNVALAESLDPSRFGGAKLAWNLLTVFVLLFYFSLPKWAEMLGIGIVDANWKPHAFFYRFSFFFAVPTFFLVYAGFGGQAAIGEIKKGDLSYAKALAPEGKSLSDSNVGDFLVLGDGFVGLNVSRAIIETLDIPKGASARKQIRADEEFEKKTR